MAGETTSLAAGAWRDANYVPLRGDAGALMWHELTATYSNTNQLEANDVMEVAYLPAGMKIVAISVTATDMDTNGAPLLTQKITIGSTDVLTGNIDARSGATAYYPLPTPYSTAAYDLLKVINTAAAATGATGSLKIRLHYVNVAT